MQSGSIRNGGIRFTPNDFKYNGRVALALLPCLVVLAGIGGAPVAGTLVVGGAAIYTLDLMRYKEGAFTAAWMTMGIANLGMLYQLLIAEEDRSIPLLILTYFLNTITLSLTGLWATLQFRWIQLQYPAVVLAFEKLLISGSIPIPAAVITLGLASGGGASDAPYYLAALLCGLYFLFGRPLPSSYHGKKETALGGAPSMVVGGGGSTRQGVPREWGGCVQDGAEGVVCFLLVAFLPVLMYLMTHLVVILQWYHLWSLLLLGGGPILFITCLPDGLWWAGSGGGVASLRRLLLLASLAVFLAGLEGRVVFYSLGQYISLAPPWNYLTATLALYGMAALVLLHFAGALGQETEAALLGPLLMGTSAVGGLAAGLPLWMLPAPLLSAAGLSMFYDTRAVRDYLLFTVAGMITAGWFVRHHFWFLEIDLGHMSLHTLCLLIGAVLLLTMLVPGLVIGGVKGAAVGGVLVAQAALLCVLEEQLYGGDHEEVTHNVHTMYPAFLVAATSGLGLLVSRRLLECDVIGEVSSYLLTCLYCAKLTMLVLPEAELLIPSLLLFMAITPPLLLHGRSRSRSGVPRPPPASHPHLNPVLGVATVILVVLAVLAARFAIFDVVQFLMDRRPSEAVVAGVLVLCMVCGCLPLVSRYYSRSAAAKRALLLGACCGLLLIMLRPPLPIKGGSECPKLPFGLCPRMWNEEHTPHHEQDDISIYGDGLRRREHWPLWFLLGAVLFGLGALTSPGAAHKLAGARLAEAAVSAALVGAYLALDFFPGMLMLQVVMVCSTLLVSAFMVLLQLRGKAAAVLLPLLGALWVVTFPVAMLVQAVSELPPLPHQYERLFPDAEREVSEERQEAIRSAVLAVFAGEALLLAFAMKLRVSAAASRDGGPRLPTAPPASLGLDASYVDRAAGFLGQCVPVAALQPGGRKSMLQGSGGVAVQRLHEEGIGWVPSCANLVTLAAFILALVLNTLFTGGREAGVLVLAPLLLLLSQDPLLCPTLTQARRYFPPVAAAAAALTLSTLYRLLFQFVLDEGEVMVMDWYSVWHLLKNTACLAVCLPSLWELLRHLWGGWGLGGSSREAAQGMGGAGGEGGGMQAMWVLALAPLSVLAIVLSDYEGVWILGGMGLVGAAVQLVSMRSRRLAGMKVI